MDEEIESSTVCKVCEPREMFHGKHCRHSFLRRCEYEDTPEGRVKRTMHQALDANKQLRQEAKKRDTGAVLAARRAVRVSMGFEALLAITSSVCAGIAILCPGLTVAWTLFFCAVILYCCWLDCCVYIHMERLVDEMWSRVSRFAGLNRVGRVKELATQKLFFPFVYLVALSGAMFATVLKM